MTFITHSPDRLWIAWPDSCLLENTPVNSRCCGRVTCRQLFSRLDLPHMLDGRHTSSILEAPIELAPVCRCLFCIAQYKNQHLEQNRKVLSRKVDYHFSWFSGQISVHKAWETTDISHCKGTGSHSDTVFQGLSHRDAPKPTMPYVLSLK